MAHRATLALGVIWLATLFFVSAFAPGGRFSALRDDPSARGWQREALSHGVSRNEVLRRTERVAGLLLNRRQGLAYGAERFGYLWTASVRDEATGAELLAFFWDGRDGGLVNVTDRTEEGAGDVLDSEGLPGGLVDAAAARRGGARWLSVLGMEAPGRAWVSTTTVAAVPAWRLHWEGDSRPYEMTLDRKTGALRFFQAGGLRSVSWRRSAR